MTKTISFAAIAAIAMTAGLANAQYQLDDDSGENNIGVTGGSISWGNMFVVDPNFTTITSIDFGFGVDTAGDFTLVGETVNWAILGDNDNDPTNGTTTLLTGTHTILTDDFMVNGLLDSIAIANLDVSGFSNFMVSASYDDSVSPGGFPAAIDQTSSLGQSWANISLDQTNFAGGGTIDSFGLPGNWIIRANAIPAPGAMALLGLGGLVATRRRR
jgi:hypothetical protein